jgi:hypothetical protein
VGPDVSSGAAVLAGDVLFEPIASPRPGGWSSRFVRRWERLGPRTWRLEILGGVRFSDGTPVTSADLAEALRSQELEVASVSAGAIVVQQGRAGQPLEVALANGVVARRAGTGFLGTGAFAVDSKAPDRLVLRRVEAVPGRIARLELRAYPSSREAFAGLLRGEVNAMYPIDRAFAELLDGVPGIRVVRGGSPGAAAVFLGPRLGAEERRAVAAWMPTREIAAAMRREVARAESRAQRPPLPPGRPLRIGYPRSIELARASLALRQALGPRGGDAVAVGMDEWSRRAPDFDLFVNTVLARPPGIEALYYESGAPYNWMGYSNPEYDAALAAGDERRAQEALEGNPPAVLISRRERMAAIDARLPEARLGDWGALEFLPEWEVAP